MVEKTRMRKEIRKGRGRHVGPRGRVEEACDRSKVLAGRPA